MLKTLIFKPFFVRGLFVLAALFLFATVFIVIAERKASPEVTAYFGVSLSAFISGKKIQYFR